MTIINNIDSTNNVFNDSIKKTKSSSSDEYKKIFDKKMDEVESRRPPEEKPKADRVSFRDTLDQTKETLSPRVIEGIQNTSDIREDKVEYYKKLIDSGKYHVSGEQIAEKLMKTGIFKDL